MFGEMQLTKKAISHAMELHRGQVRQVSGLPYITHPIEVYSIVKKYKESHNIDNICAAAVLHDTMEDCGISYDLLKIEYNPMIADLVMEVTNDNRMMLLYGGKRNYINQKLNKISSYALVIKLADILSNVTDNPTEAQIKRIKHHYDFLASSNARKLSETHKRILDQINYSLYNLYGVA